MGTGRIITAFSSMDLADGADETENVKGLRFSQKAVIAAITLSF